MELFDTHFHYYGDISPEEYYAKSASAGVIKLLAAGADFEESKKAKEFSDIIENAWFSAGVHPHSASQYTDSISMFEEFADEDKMVAVGEIGLDYYYENSERNIQRKVFEKFIELSLKLELPAIIHCRDKDGAEDAYKDAYSILSDFTKDKGSFVLHCYAGTTFWAEKFIEQGAFFGVGGIVTFPRAENIRNLLSVIPNEKMVLETDTPYLAPVPHRGKKNHSAYMIETARKVAEVKNIPLEEIAKITTSNAITFFKIK